MTLQQLYDNPILQVDGYNLCHSWMKENMDFEVSHIYNRNAPMILFGFNENVRNILTQKITKLNVHEALDASLNMGVKGFPAEMWHRVVDEFSGYIPLLVSALPDGTWCPKGTPFAQVSNTVKGFGELVTWFEGRMLHSSFASGCATRAFMIRKYLEHRGDDLRRVHSFGFRGHNSMENAYWAGIAWSTFLPGSDDAHIYTHLHDINTIPATAHKVIQQYDDEYVAYLTAIYRARDTGNKIVAIVIDTYNPVRFIDNYAAKLCTYAKELGIHLVFRPDSGEVMLQTVEIFRKLQEHDNFSVIIGEGIDFEKVQLYDKLFDKEDYMDTKRIFFGMGSGYYKDINRDTLGWAMKTAFSNDKDRMKFSADPIKQSIPGKIRIESKHGMLEVNQSEQSNVPNQLKTIYSHDGGNNSPICYPQSYLDINNIALLQDISQKEIILNDVIKEKIERFRSKYL